MLYSCIKPDNRQDIDFIYSGKNRFFGVINLASEKWEAHAITSMPISVGAGYVIEWFCSYVVVVNK